MINSISQYRSDVLISASSLLQSTAELSQTHVTFLTIDQKTKTNDLVIYLVTQLTIPDKLRNSNHDFEV